MTEFLGFTDFVFQKTSKKKEEPVTDPVEDPDQESHKF